MAERRVVVDSAVPGRPGDLAIRINGDDPTFRMYLGHSYHRTLDWIEPRARDLAIIACAVFAADSLTKRGSDARPDFGTKWFRDFHFVVPVEDLDFWSQPATRDTLAEALRFLTGDTFTFTFVRSMWRRPASLFTELPAPMRRGDEVILFSGGLDSLTGALETLESGSGDVLLVSHRSAPKVSRIQKELSQQLRMRYPGRVHWFPVGATMVGREATETTQRARSFLLAAIGYIAARHFDCHRLRFFENGIVSLNLPISRQVVSTMASRTTHPLVLRHIAKLLSLVAGATMVVDNPYVWRTKAEVVAKLAPNHGADLARRTMSCSNVRERTRLHTHCGRCSQCLDRRFAMLAAGLAASDPSEMYEIDVIVGQKDEDEDRTMALDWARHAHGLSTVDGREFRGKFMAEIDDLLAGFPDEAAWEVHANALDLHRRHGQAISQVLTAAIRENATALLSQTFPPGSLLRMFVADRARMPDAQSSAVPAVLERGPMRDATAAIFPLRVTLTADPPVATVHGLGDIEGAATAIIQALRPIHEQDCATIATPDAHRYTAVGEIARSTGSSKNAIRQHVKRCRSQLADYYEAIEGSPPPRDLLIENKIARGYRLDPECRFVEPTDA